VLNCIECTHKILKVRIIFNEIKGNKGYTFYFKGENGVDGE